MNTTHTYNDKVQLLDWKDVESQFDPDPAIEDSKCYANGIGGVYAIRLETVNDQQFAVLFRAEDEYDHIQFDTVAEAKQHAEKEFQSQIARRAQLLGYRKTDN